MNNEHTEAVTPLVMAMLRLCLPEVWYLLWIFLPTQTGIPMIMAGMEMPAIRAIPTGAPTRVPSCHISFFFRLQGFFPQNVQPAKMVIKYRKVPFFRLFLCQCENLGYFS